MTFPSNFFEVSKAKLVPVVEFTEAERIAIDHARNVAKQTRSIDRLPVRYEMQQEIYAGGRS